MNAPLTSARPEPAKPTVLIVDDEPDLLELVSLTLSRMNLRTRTAGDVSTARKLLKSEVFDLCLTDMRLPDGDGLDLVAWIQENRSTVPVAVITAHGNVESAVRALKLGAFDFVSKPLDLGVLRKLVGSAIRLGASGSSDASADPSSARLIGHSQVMEQLREMISRVSRSQAPVHIFGESGTGKELVARMIHESGARREGPFVAVNCGAIPTELMESELFGHKRGSFTGAVADKKGLVQTAEGGTLFLDEVADLPLHMQVKLLRVVQEKTVRPVGESREETVDVRILSATHKNLAELVAQGLFREDLFYRINVIELRVPGAARAARGHSGHRPGDPGETRTSHRYATAASGGRRARAPAVLSLPGQRARARERPRARPHPLRQRRDHRRSHQAAHHAAPDSGRATANRSCHGRRAPPSGEHLEGIERDAIVKALEKTRYNKTAAAKLLGMSFRALRYRIKKLGIE